MIDHVDKVGQTKRRLYRCDFGGGGGEIIVESETLALLWMGCSTIRLVTTN